MHEGLYATFEFIGYPGIVDRGSNLAAMTNDAVILYKTFDICLVKTGHLADSKAVEGASEAFSTLENG